MMISWPVAIRHTDYWIVEISRGNVYIGENSRNCYGDNIDWTDIFDKGDQRANISVIDKNCPPKAGEENLVCWSNTVCNVIYSAHSGLQYNTFHVFGK